MKVAYLALLVTSWLYCSYATPVIVWKKPTLESSSIYSSKSVDVLTLISSVISSSSLKNIDNWFFSLVIFIIDRKVDGTEGLNRLLYQGPEKIPNIAEKYDKAHSIHTHVSGVKGHSYVAKKVEQISGSPERVKVISLHEFKRKLTELKQNTAADILIVKVSNNFSNEKVDVNVNAAIENSNINTVLLMGVSALDELHYEKTIWKNINSPLTFSGRRHLEDQVNNNNEDNEVYYTPSGIYYVKMTPNIMAGILFMIFFTFATYIGIMKLNMISATDVYVKKYYSIGKEA